MCAMSLRLCEKGRGRGEEREEEWRGVYIAISLSLH